jgi:hypothetical protein
MESFFRFINMYPMPLWLAMMFAPRHELTKRAAHSSGLFGLAALNYLKVIQPLSGKMWCSSALPLATSSWRTRFGNGISTC